MKESELEFNIDKFVARASIDRDGELLELREILFEIAERLSALEKQVTLFTDIAEDIS